MKKKIKSELYENMMYIIISFVISFMTVLPQFMVSCSLKRSILAFLLMLLLIFSAKISKIVFSVFILYLNLVNIIQMNVYLHWGGEPTLNNRFEVMVRSPLAESIEYLQTFVDYRDILMVVYVISIFVILYIFVLKCKHTFSFLRKIAILFFLVLFALLVTKEPLFTAGNYIRIRNNFLQNNIIIEKRNVFLKNLKIEKENNSTIKYDKVVIVVGESVNKHFINRENSPFISSLIEAGRAYMFDAISPANQTRYAVPMLFTKANVSKWRENFIHSESILTNFKVLGYKTYWISNQGHIGKHEDWITNIANEADVKIFFNNNYQEANSDIVISEYLKNLKIDNNKEVYVFHLMGSHFQYSKRYTKKFLLHKNPMNIVQQYENSIYFTDQVIKSIFDKFADNGRVLLVYVSDHAEVVSNALQGHGFLPTYRDEYQIPLVIYSNIDNERVKGLYKENKKHFFNTENLDSIITYISYISDDVNISKSSEIFSLEPRNKFDFNKLKGYKQF